MSLCAREWMKLYPAFLVGGVLLAGCGPSNIERYISPELRTYSLKTIAVVPFQPHRIHESDPLMKSGQVSPDGPPYLTDLFVQELKEVEGFRVHSMTEVRTVLSSVDVRALWTSREGLRKFGELLSADGIVLGLVDVFEERQGGPYGVERPAAVGFVVQLIRPQNGAVLWEGSYYERQKSLVEDIRNIHLFFRRKGRWVTAKDLAEFGTLQLLKGFPNPTVTESNHGDHSSH